MNNPLLPNSHGIAEIRALSVPAGRWAVAVVARLHAVHCPLNFWQREAVGDGDQNVCGIQSIGEEIANDLGKEIC